MVVLLMFGDKTWAAFQDYKWIPGTKYREKDAFGRTALSNCVEL